MNVERMLYLADQLENPTDPRLARVAFSMLDFSYPEEYVPQAIYCGTAACIGGHACILFGGESIHGFEAKVLLDLTVEQARQLFYNDKGYINTEHHLSEITREDAVAAIRRMVQEHVDEAVAGMEPGALIPVMQRPGMSVAESLKAQVADAVCR